MGILIGETFKEHLKRREILKILSDTLNEGLLHDLTTEQILNNQSKAIIKAGYVKEEPHAKQTADR